MRIGIDARELCGQPTGVGRYLDGLLAEWAGGDDGRDGTSSSSTRTSRSRHAGRAAALPLATGRAARRSTLVGTGSCLPRAAARPSRRLLRARLHRAACSRACRWSWRFTMCRSPRIPNGFAAREGLRRRLVTRRRRRARAPSSTISEFSQRRDSSSTCGAPAGASTSFRPGISTPARRPPATRPHQQTLRVLFVGSIFNRRHVPDLIRAFGQPRAARIRCVRSISSATTAPIPHEDLDAPIAAPGRRRPDPVAPLRARRRAGTRSTIARAPSLSCRNTKASG